MSDKSQVKSHSGDCSIYSTAQICDCGYLRSAVFQPEPIAPEIHEAWAKHCRAIDAAGELQAQLTEARSAIALLSTEKATLQAQLAQTQDRECEAASLYEGMKDQLTQAHKERPVELIGKLAEVRCNMDHGKAFLDRMKEAEWLLDNVLDLVAFIACDEAFEWQQRRDAFLKGGVK